MRSRKVMLELLIVITPHVVRDADNNAREIWTK